MASSVVKILFIKVPLKRKNCVPEKPLTNLIAFHYIIDILTGLDVKACTNIVK